MKGKIAWPVGRPDTMEAHQTIYRDKLNGRQCEAGPRQRCARTTLAPPFLNLRYTVKGDGRRIESDFGQPPRTRQKYPTF